MIYKKKLSAKQAGMLNRMLNGYPADLFTDLEKAARLRGESLYVTGGAVRDWLLGTAPHDLDFTIDHGSLAFVRTVKEIRGEGRIVPLGLRHDDTCRIVIGDLVVDVSGFRLGTTSITEDLARRDFSVNAMAVEVADIVEGGWDIGVIDPMNGLTDMAQRIVRVCPGAFPDDPLRMIRAFRFAAVLGYQIEAKTLEAMSSRGNLINMSAMERVSYECNLIMASPRAHAAIIGMKMVGLLGWVVPELYEGKGVEQPASHHLDVFRHNLLTLDYLEKIVADPDSYFPLSGERMRRYLQHEERVMLLKWAALFHDVGKPAVQKRLPEKGDRITFYGHDQEGVKIFELFAERMKWSRKHREFVSRLIRMHMHPFHLCNVEREDGELTLRSKLKICRKAEDDLPGLFILAMADSLAGQGSEKPAGMEKQLAFLFAGLDDLYGETIKPVLSGPKLLTGHDLIDTLGLVPGPLFREILAALDLAVVERKVKQKDEALDWVRAYLARMKEKPDRDT